MTIKILSQNIINQIAAGEVIERPASVLKELVENAIDAGSDKIDIRIENGGKSYLSVSDNGCGMDKETLSLCILRHATSKLPDDDLFNIHSFGFRGEALPSIGSVARLKITSTQNEESWSIAVEGGEAKSLKPSVHPKGTKIEMRDLFFATPARLKFLKSDSSELLAIKETLYKIAMVHPHISFTLSDEKKKLIHLPSTNLEDRVCQIIASGFKENKINISYEKDGLKITGYISLPTFTKSTTSSQHFFVNNRWISDRMFFGCVKAGYQGFSGLGLDGYPIVVLFLELPTSDVDVNVHPNKTQVRFKDLSSVKSLIIHAISDALSQNSNRSSSVLSKEILKPFPLNIQHSFIAQSQISPTLFLKENIQSFKPAAHESASVETFNTYPLGMARIQLYDTYILSQKDDAFFLIDMHAAHERLMYEKISKNIKLEEQLLLSPEIIEIDEEKINLLDLNILKKFAFDVERFGHGALIIRSVPTLLKDCDIHKICQDFIDSFIENANTSFMDEKIKNICARIACHSSVRSGRKLTTDEMNSLLRQMEASSTSGQCIHGRPTYIEIKLTDLERLFGR